MMKPPCVQEPANSQTATPPAAKPSDACTPAPLPGTPDFPERRDDPAQAEELERQQDA